MPLYSRPSGLDTMPAIVLALAKLGLVNLHDNFWTTNDSIVCVQ